LESVSAASFPALVCVLRNSTDERWTPGAAGMASVVTAAGEACAAAGVAAVATRPGGPAAAGEDLRRVGGGDSNLNQAHHAGDSDLALGALLAAQERAQDAIRVLDGSPPLVHVLECSCVVPRGAKTDVVVLLLHLALSDAVIAVMLVTLVDGTAAHISKGAAGGSACFHVPFQFARFVHPPVSCRTRIHLVRFAVLDPVIIGRGTGKEHKHGVYIVVRGVPDI